MASPEKVIGEKLEFDKKGVLSYPTSDDAFFTDPEQYTSFTVYKYSAGFKKDNSDSNIEFEIQLPLPLQISEDVGLGFTETGGIIANVLKDQTVSGAITGIEEAFSSGNFNRLKSVASGIDADSALGLVKTIGAAGIISKLGSDAATIQQEAAKRGAASQINPFTSVFFTSPDLKTYNFNYVFMPRNPREADEVRRIISRFRYYSHPDVEGAASFFRQPEIFEIEFLPSDKYLHKPNRCVLQGMSVSYSDQSNNTFIRGDGEDYIPVDTSLSLTFREIEYDTKRTIREKYGVNRDN